MIWLFVFYQLRRKAVSNFWHTKSLLPMSISDTCGRRVKGWGMWTMFSRVCKEQRLCSTLSNVAYARHSRGKITQSVKLNRKNNFINLTNSPLYKPFCSVLFAKKRYKNSPPWPSSCILFVEQWATSRNLPSELNSVVWRGTPPLSRKPSDNRKKLRHSRAKRDCLRRKPKNHDKKGGFLDINAFLCGGNLRIAPKFCVS